ncbi:hypothetical protein, partial [Agrobacterium salinitolerans]
TEVSLHGINTSRKAKSVTHVSGTKRHLSLKSDTPRPEIPARPILHFKTAAGALWRLSPLVTCSSVRFELARATNRLLPIIKANCRMRRLLITSDIPSE